MGFKTLDERVTEALRVRRLAADHHSTGDWDFSSADWELDATIFHSPPTSLQTLGAAVIVEVLIKTGVVPNANMRQGRIDTYLYYNTLWAATFFGFSIRFQDATNFYYVKIQADGAALIQRVHSVAGDVILASGNLPVTPTVWERWRATWWDDYVGIAIRLEKYVGAAWVTQLEGYDAPNYWKAAGGRSGFRFRRAQDADARNLYVDDTYLYGVV